jgi:hypothetical protein
MRITKLYKLLFFLRESLKIININIIEWLFTYFLPTEGSHSVKYKFRYIFLPMTYYSFVENWFKYDYT